MTKQVRLMLLIMRNATAIQKTAYVIGSFISK